MRYPVILLVLIAGPGWATGVLSPNIRISSDVLGYDLQYRTYTPAEYESLADLPVLFLTDGPSYISRGGMPRTMDALIESGKIGPLVAVFVDPRDPDDLRNNRRNRQFLCNEDYLRFFVDELIPTIEDNYAVARDRGKRTILGLSFGGTNAACFGLLGSDTFSGIGMHSPANHPVPRLLPAYRRQPRLPLKIFLSTGVPDDNTRANREFHSVLEEKGYPMKYVETPEGHNWDNWRPLIDDVLLYFYGTDPEPDPRSGS